MKFKLAFQDSTWEMDKLLADQKHLVKLRIWLLERAMISMSEQFVMHKMQVVREHAQEVEAAGFVDTLVAQPRHVGQTLVQLALPLFQGIPEPRFSRRGGDIGPARQLVAIFERKVE